MKELFIDFITSLDGYGAAEGWPGWWGLEGPDYLGWLGEQPERDYTLLMGANTYRLMSGFAAEAQQQNPGKARTDEDDSFATLTEANKLVFSSTLESPLSLDNSRLIREDAVQV